MLPHTITGLLPEEGEWLQKRQNLHQPRPSFFLTLSLPVTLHEKGTHRHAELGVVFQSKEENKVPLKDK